MRNSKSKSKSKRTVLKRTLERVLKGVSNTFPVLLLTGPRQIGKTTLLEGLKSKKRTYITLDDLEQRELAKKDPSLFLQVNKTPLMHQNYYHILR